MASSRAILVLGMHRSGTSVLTRGLRALDVYLGEDFLETKPDNPTGYWENRFIQKLNERVLATFGLSWEEPGLITDEQWARAELEPLRREAADYLRSHFLDHAVWAFKDPQTILLLPFWRPIFQELGVEERAILALRNPLSVAESLRARQQTPAADAHLLWLLHLVPNLARVAERPFVVVDYDRLMVDPEGQLTRAAQWMELPAGERQRAALAEFSRTFVSANLRHHQFAADEFGHVPALGPASREAYLRLSQMAADEVPPKSERFWAAWNRLQARTIALVTPLIEKKKEGAQTRQRERTASRQFAFIAKRNFPDVRLFIVTGTQRTGTNLLREVLNTNPRIAMVAEVLTPCPEPGRFADPRSRTVQSDEEIVSTYQLPGAVPAPMRPGLNFMAHWGNFLRTVPTNAFPAQTPAAAEELLDKYVRHLRNTITRHWVGGDKAGVTAIGVDIKYSHFQRLAPRNWDPGLPPFLLCYFKARGATLIHGLRRNLIQCAISALVMEQTGRHHNYNGAAAPEGIILEPHAVLDKARWIRRERDKFFVSSGDIPLVEYEYMDLSRDVARAEPGTGHLADQPGPLHGIATALEVPYEFRNPGRLKKSINIPYRRLLGNFEQLVRAVEESEFREFAASLE